MLSLACLLLWTTPVLAQSASVEEQIERFKDKVLTLRHFSSSSRLRFDETGLPKKVEEAAPWALYAQFLVRTMDLNSNRLLLRGPRIVSHYDAKAKKMVQFRSNLQVEVVVDAKPGMTSGDLAVLISRVFVPPGELVNYVPGYWKEFLSGSTAEASPPPPAPDVQPRSGDVMQAELRKMVRPTYPEDARQYRFEGVVVLRAEISESGDVEDLMIVAPAGAGFDENAAQAVYQWKYNPQTLDGKPVRVLTTITVNYYFDR